MGGNKFMAVWLDIKWFILDYLWWFFWEFFFWILLVLLVEKLENKFTRKLQEIEMGSEEELFDAGVTIYNSKYFFEKNQFSVETRNLIKCWFKKHKQYF